MLYAVGDTEQRIGNKLQFCSTFSPIEVEICLEYWDKNNDMKIKKGNF